MLLRLMRTAGKVRKQLISSSMDRIEKLLLTDDNIEKAIMAIRCEVGDVEAKIIDSILIERLEKENRELEQEIQKYKNELTQLELTNGRRQELFYSFIEKPVKENIQNKPALKTSSEKNAVEDSTAKKEESKKTMKELKKSEKTDSSKKDGSEEHQVNIGRLDLRVGKILKIDKHPDADTLYVEKIDIGRQEPITVVSGLVKHISENEMMNSLVIILANMKPAKMRGITSEGMVMCASLDGAVEVLRPPPSSIPGDVVLCPGYTYAPDGVLNPKKKVFESVAPDLKTDNDAFATYKGIRWNIEAKGNITAATLKGAIIK